MNGFERIVLKNVHFCLRGHLADPLTFTERDRADCLRWARHELTSLGYHADIEGLDYAGTLAFCDRLIYGNVNAPMLMAS